MGQATAWSLHDRGNRIKARIGHMSDVSRFNVGQDTWQNAAKRGKTSHSAANASVQCK